MAIDFRIPIAAALTVLIATGCGPGVEADLSPDGRTLAQTDPNGLSLRSTEGGPTQRIVKGAMGQPRFSPDGRTIAVERLKGRIVESILVNPATKATQTLPAGLRGPFAWRPDGSELLTWRGTAGHVYHLASRTVVREIDLSEAPTRAQWLPGGRDIVAASEHALMIVNRGHVRRIDTKETILSLGYDAARDRVIWSEARLVGEDATRLSAYAVPRTGGERVTLMKDANPAKFLDSPGPYAMPVALAISPDGTRLAIAAVVEPAPVGTWKRLMDLQRQVRTRRKDKALLAEIERVKGEIRFDLAVATTAVTGGPVTTVALHRNLKEFTDAPESLHWSQSGDRLALVTRNGVEVLEAH